MAQKQKTRGGTRKYGRNIRKYGKWLGPSKKRLDTREGNFPVNVRRYTLGGIRNEMLPAYVLAQPWTAAQWRQRLANQATMSKTDVMLMRKGLS